MVPRGYELVRHFTTCEGECIARVEHQGGGDQVAGPLQDPVCPGQDPTVRVPVEEGHVLAHDVQHHVLQAERTTYGEDKGTGGMVQK